jgi:hypothetical protein
MAKRKAPGQGPPKCKQCGGRVMVHGGVAECTVPGCGWKAKL